MPIEPIVDGIIDMIDQNMIARTNVTSNVLTGDIIINVEDSFRYRDNEEIVLIDYNYNVPGTDHYNIFEYAKIDTVNNTRSITLQDPVEGNWTLADKSFIQKTIGHSPLYTDQIYYGDREVIPFDQMAITVEPQSLGNEWIYIQGGLSEEYRIMITIYGKDIKFEEGRRILDRYSDSVYQLLNDNLHFDVNNYETPLMQNVVTGSNVVVVEDTPENEQYFTLSPTNPPVAEYQLQDNNGASCFASIINRVIAGGFITLTLDIDAGQDYTKSEFGVFRKIGTYIYDSRVDAVTYGEVSKGSAYLRASQLSWFGKLVNRFRFPQRSRGVDDFTKIP